MYSKLCEEKSLRKVAELLYTFEEPLMKWENMLS